MEAFSRGVPGRNAPAFTVICTLVVAVLFVAVEADLAAAGVAKQQQQKQEQQQQQEKEQPKKRKSRIRETCAGEMGLITERETAKSYARHSQTLCAINASSSWADKNGVFGEVLGFVTPWHDHGYKAARYFRRTLSSVSPLWFRILPGRDEKAAAAFDIVGADLAKEQKTWKEQASAGNVDMLPHFSIEGFSRMDALRAILEEPYNLAAEIAVMCEHSSFQGIVFDVRAALFVRFRPLLPGLVKALSQALRASLRRLFLSVPPLLQSSGIAALGVFGAEDAGAVAPYVDGVIVGTRDYSREAPGPQSPLPWVRACLMTLMGSSTVDETNVTALRPDQLLLEIPLYGRAFQAGQEEGRVILTPEIAKALSKQRPKLVWDAEAREHSANISAGASEVTLTFPTLAFVAERLRLARSMGVGVALRDLGAGLDYAFDLFPRRPDDDDDDVSTQVGDGDPASVPAHEGEL